MASGRGTVIKAVKVTDAHLVFRVSGSGDEVGSAEYDSAQRAWTMDMNGEKTLHRSVASMLRLLKLAPIRKV